jgi:hypothetical protein
MQLSPAAPATTTAKAGKTAFAFSPFRDFAILPQPTAAVIVKAPVCKNL